MSNFIIQKPSSGWIHSDNLISNKGATYAIRYIGCLEVNVSMKKLDYKTRSSVAKVCISRVCEAAGLKTADKKRRVDKKVLRAIVDTPNLDNAGTNVNLTVSSSQLSLVSLESGAVIACHDMPRISFASGGDADTLDFVAYIAKDVADWRACYVLECGGGLAKDVISTIGQAFELRFKQYMKPVFELEQQQQHTLHSMAGASSSDIAAADKDYYNDLPGKVPPDVVGPPPAIPPLPIVVPHPINTLPAVQATSPNLIDLNTEGAAAAATTATATAIATLPGPRHDYVNDLFTRSERDDFGMSPFTHHHHHHQQQSSVSATGTISRKLSTVDQLAQLQHEVWFHGHINRTEAERLLVRDGDFLVRESPASTGGGQYVLSGMQDNTKKHLLLIDPEGVVRTKDMMFNSVSHLINYYFERTLPIISAESALVLRTPVYRTSH